MGLGILASCLDEVLPLVVENSQSFLYLHNERTGYVQLIFTGCDDSLRKRCM